MVANYSRSQDFHPIILDFNAFSSGNQILLKWTIEAGKSCNGTIIEHSTDSIVFNQVGQIEGICGGEETPVPFEFLHTSPRINSKNYYRLVLGTQGFSNPLPIIHKEKGQYQLYPNPIDFSSKILFANPKTESYLLSIYSLDGTKVFSLENVQDEEIPLNILPNHLNGQFWFRLISPNGITLLGDFVKTK